MYIHGFLQNLDVPNSIIANVIKEFVASISSNFTKICKENLNDFSMKLRNPFRNRRTLSIDNHNLRANGPFPTYLGNLEIEKRKSRGFQWSDVKKDFKIVYDKYKRKFYLHAPILVEKKIVENKKPLISLDPGEKNFLFGYAMDHYFKIGENVREGIRKRLEKVDQIRYEMSKPKKKKRKWKLKRAMNRQHKKIDNYVTELHNKSNIYLCKNYERILMPDFSSKSVSSTQGDLNPMTKRVLGKMSHYRLRISMEEKCKEYSSQYFEVNESYTTKTCGRCGCMDTTINPDERKLTCKSCDLEIDRDLNGARNILIKNSDLVLRIRDRKKK
jgi:transposase